MLLYLHGGPGETVAPLCHSLARRLVGQWSLATFDQRGAGRTLLKNPDARPSTQMMLEDLDRVIEYLHNKCGVEKIALLGHSWGSVLGSLYALEHPDKLMCYIGVGQVVSMMENEAEGMRVLCCRIEQSGNAKDAEALAAIGTYPGNSNDMMQKMPAVRKLQRKYGLAMKIDRKLLWSFISAPTFRLRDIKAMKLGTDASVALDDELAAFDLKDCQPVYHVPIYYVLGREDNQTPYVLGARYLDSIEAPDKALFPVPHAGHSVPTDNLDGFASAMSEILKRLQAFQGSI